MMIHQDGSRYEWLADQGLLYLRQKQSISSSMTMKACLFFTQWSEMGNYLYVAMTRKKNDLYCEFCDQSNGFYSDGHRTKARCLRHLGLLVSWPSDRPIPSLFPAEWVDIAMTAPPFAIFIVRFGLRIPEPAT
jgi:hypothetical protein